MKIKYYLRTPIIEDDKKDIIGFIVRKDAPNPVVNNDENNNIAYFDYVDGVFISHHHPLYNDIMRTITNYKEEK